MSGVRLLVLVAASQRNRSDDDRTKCEHAEGSEEAGRERLAVESEPGGDRQCIREQRRDTGGGEGAAALKAELERNEREPVASEDCRDHKEPNSSRDGSLRSNVTGGVEDACRGAQARPRGKHPSCGSCGESCGPKRSSDPDYERKPAGVTATGSLPDE